MADVKALSDGMASISLASKAGKEKIVPPPLSVTGTVASSKEHETVPETPIVTEHTLEEEVRPSLDMVSRRRGGVCITEPNHRTVVTMGQIKQFYEQDATD
ncbi:hypothetical protein HDU97_002334 [Phlyctochytrium planicorne]|nr:hypothetical protein HDU97_002334 [Phlyctochytrium planicorne]